MPRKRVLLLIPNLDFGGAQRSFSKLSIELSNRYEVYVGVFNTEEGIAYSYGGTLLNLDIPGANSISGKLLNFKRRINKVREIKEKHRIDVCISFLEGADYVNLLSKKEEKTIVSIRGSKIFDGEISGLFGFIRKRMMIPLLYKRADRVVTVSEGLKNEMEDYFGLDRDKITTIYNFYEVEKISQEAAEELPIQFEQIFRHPIIINSGRLHVQKNQASLLRIFAKVKQQNVAKLIILGDGPMREELLSLSNHLGLKTFSTWAGLMPDETFDVYFLGYQENPFKYISKAYVFAFTSSWEGFPNALAESMACNVPVVSTDCPTGPREILAPGTSLKTNLTEAEYGQFGLLLPLCNDKDIESAEGIWADHLNKFIINTSLKEDYRVKAVERVKDFTKSSIVREWLEVIDL